MITQQMKDVANEIDKKFHYTYDKQNKDTWTFLDIEDKEQVFGDCEDYSLTVAKALSGGSVKTLIYNLLTRKCSLYYVKMKSSGEGHCVMSWKDVEGDGKDMYIDNCVKSWSTRDRMEVYIDFKYRDFLPFVLWKLWKNGQL